MKPSCFCTNTKQAKYSRLRVGEEEALAFFFVYQLCSSLDLQRYLHCPLPPPMENTIEYSTVQYCVHVYFPLGVHFKLFLFKKNTLENMN